MQTVTLNMGSWLRRLVVRNSLVRASDRIEATAIFVGLASAVLVVPFAGALGTAIYDNRVHAFTAERLAVHEVEATATQDSSVTRVPYQSSVLTPLQWQFAGHTHTNIVSTRGEMEVGERTSIWVDAAGDRVERLPSDLDAAVEAVMAAFGIWVAVAGVAPQAGRCCAPGSIGCGMPLGTVNSTTSRQRRPDEPQCSARTNADA